MLSRSYSPFAKRSHSLNRNLNNLKHLRIVRELCQLVFDGKQISSFVGNELVQIHQTVEEDPYLWQVLPQLLQSKVPLRR